MQPQLPGFVEIFFVRLKADAMAENRCNIVVAARCLLY